MISKEDFCKHFKSIDEIRKTSQLTEKALGVKYLGDDNIFHRLEDSIVDLLSIAVEDENELISYWIYDLDMGGEVVYLSINDENYHNPKNESELYDLLLTIKNTTENTGDSI